MISSEKIDLTENRDFSSFGNIDVGFDEAISMRDFYDRKELMEKNKLTFEEYERLRRIESIFGMSRHYNEKNEIFEVKADYSDKGHCLRRGKEIRAPWKNYFGLCEECNREDEMRVSDVRGLLEDDKGRELFALK